MKSVWEEKSFDELVFMSEEQAVRVHFDHRNCVVLFRLLVLVVIAALVTIPPLIEERGTLWLLVPAINLLLVRGLYWLRERPFFTRHFRACLIGYLIVQVLCWKSMTFELPLDPLDFIVPWVLIFFRLPDGLLAVPASLYWAISVGSNLVEAWLAGGELKWGLIIGQTVTTLVAVALVHSLTRKRRGEFVARWRREHFRQRERQRMQDELDDARKIQLSMLPRSDPKLTWLDVAGISIPASEVGGDYYDYFTISDDRQAIAVGDVAGHGVASGLLLSGIRSCLYLLQDTPLPPVEILRKLDRMVRQTTGSRMFVTLLYAIFDRETRRLTFSAAGHPPLLRITADRGRFDELTLEALPLGTGLASQPQQVEVPYEPGDVFLFYTDGIAETLNARGEPYGAGRLYQRLRALPADRSAKEIRDIVLGDVWTYKADGQQMDDITMVVVRVPEPGKH